MIDRETNHARRKTPARIIAKVNALLDQPVIEALYRASRAGVEIDLIIRGACSLRPNVKDVSHRIRVRSIVGRFLEHSRIFYFANGGEPDIYLGSADWMPRNLYERVEVMFPVKNSSLRNRIFEEILGTYLKDTGKSSHPLIRMEFTVEPTRPIVRKSAATGTTSARRHFLSTWPKEKIETALSGDAVARRGRPAADTRSVPRQTRTFKILMSRQEG